MLKPLKGKPVPDGDLWRQAARAQDRRAAAGLATKVSWVKGHATLDDAEKGITTARDAWGNRQAHTLAGHQAPAGRVAARSSKRKRKEKVKTPPSNGAIQQFVHGEGGPGGA